MPSVSVTSKGQVTIPKHIRDELGIAAGSKVEFELAGSNTARMHLVGRPARSRVEDGPAILNYKGPRIPTSELQGVVAVRKAQRAGR